MINPFPLLNPINKFTDVSGVNSFFNTKIKTYPDGTINAVHCRTAIFKDSSFVRTIPVKKFFCFGAEWIEEKESFKDFLNSYRLDCVKKELKVNDLSKISLSDIKVTYNNLFVKKTKKNVEPRYDSIKRAKDRIFDYTFSNTFDYFFTGTIDPKKYNSSDSSALLLPLQNWLKNRVRRLGLRYILVAERHKSGRIHFHGLLGGDNSLNLVDSGTKKYKGYKKPMKDYTAVRKGLNPALGQIIYNMPDWKFGFTTCVKLFGDPINVSYYITKYIVKDCKKIFGKFFWHSFNLRKPIVTYDNVDYFEVETAEYKGYFKYEFIRGSELRRRKFDPNFYDICFDSDCCYNSKTGEFYYSCSAEEYTIDDGYVTIC